LEIEQFDNFTLCLSELYQGFSMNISMTLYVLFLTLTIGPE